MVGTIAAPQRQQALTSPSSSSPHCWQLKVGIEGDCDKVQNFTYFDYVPAAPQSQP